MDGRIHEANPVSRRGTELSELVVDIRLVDLAIRRIDTGWDDADHRGKAEVVHGRSAGVKFGGAARLPGGVLKVLPSEGRTTRGCRSVDGGFFHDVRHPSQGMMAEGGRTQVCRIIGKVAKDV